MRCLKLFGERIMARDPDRQAAENHIRIGLINRINVLGAAEIVRVAVRGSHASGRDNAITSIPSEFDETRWLIQQPI